MTKRLLPGLNIQYPISKLILSGEKTVETRTYPMPERYVGQEIVLVETPGSHRDRIATATCILVFGKSFKYSSKTQFHRDIARHKVEPGSQWDWSEKPKWGWPIERVIPLQNPAPVKGPRGIRFTKAISIDL